MNDLELAAARVFDFPFGMRVRVDGKRGIDGVVTGYAIYPHATEIKVSWFANGDSKTDWFADWRVESTEAQGNG